jgi:hypothetical protein
MSHFDNESDDRRPDAEGEQSAPPAEDWRRPLLLAGIGLVLMIGGYQAMNYVPPRPLTPRQAEQERLHADMRKMAAESQDDSALTDRLKDIEPPWRTPPYQIPGRLALYLGLFLFVAAGVLMYRHSPAPKKVDEEALERD